MKEFRTVAIVRHPPAEVLATVRDRMSLLAAHLDDVASVTVQSRHDHDDGTTDLVNLWRADVGIPAFLQRFIQPETLCWTDTARWDPAEGSCTWRIEPHFARDAADCRGVTRFEPAMGGRGTRIVFAGAFTIVANRLPGGIGLGPTVRRGIERFVTEVVPRSLQKVGKAVGTHLDAAAPGSHALIALDARGDQRS